MVATSKALTLRVRALIDRVANQVSPETAAIAREMVDSDEPGLALGLLGDTLVAPGVTVSPELVAEFRELAAQLGVATDAADHLRETGPSRAPLLVDAVQSAKPESGRASTSLYISIPNTVVRPLFAASVAIVGGWLSFGSSYLHWVAAGLLIVVLPLWLLLPARRADIDEEGITTVPMLAPLRSRRRYPFTELGEFARSKPFLRIEVLRAPILTPYHRSLRFRVHPSFLKLPSYLARSPGAPALTPAELEDLLHRYRDPSPPYVGVESISR